MIRRIEAKCGSWETVCDEIDPKKLYWNEGFWHAENDCKENADDFTDI